MEKLKRVRYIPSVMANNRHKGSFCDGYSLSVRRMEHLFKRHTTFQRLSMGYILLSIGSSLSDNTVSSVLPLNEQIVRKKHKL